MKIKLPAIVFCLLQAVIVSAPIANDNKTPFKLKAFSVKLPSNPEWQQKASSNQINLRRSLDGNAFHSFLLEAREYPVAPEPVSSITSLLTHISNAYSKEALKEGRYKLTKHSETVTNRLGFDCIEYNKSWVDKGGVSTRYRKLIMVAHGLICIHPDSANRLIEISYSSRNVSGVIPQASINEGIEFINSLQPLPVKSTIKQSNE